MRDKNFRRIISLMCALTLMGGCGKCGKHNAGESQSDQTSQTESVKPSLGELQPPEQRDWVDIGSYDRNDQAVASAYLAPIWYTREVYDESILIVGETGSANLLFEPEGGKITVRNYTLETTYTEGKDYTLNGRVITRIAGGNLPYFKTDQYYMKAPGQIGISVNEQFSLQTFGEQRYLYYGEGRAITVNHLNVSYRTNEQWQGEFPAGDAHKAEHFIEKLEFEKKGGIMFYGDSITVGCNASGTEYGGNVNPYLPDWPHLVTNRLEDTYGAEIRYMNAAVGGWSTASGKEHFEKEVLSYARAIDLLVLAFGMNDMDTPLEDYNRMITEMAEQYLDFNPKGTVLLVSPMMPNTESTWLGNQQYFQEVLEKIAEGNERIEVAKVSTVFKAFEEIYGKRTRDWLANNINHPDDFGVRVYAQVILKTLCGEDFFPYNYK